MAKVVIVDTDELREFIYNGLIEKGFIPSDLEAEEIADICFDYMVEKDIIDEN